MKALVKSPVNFIVVHTALATVTLNIWLTVPAVFNCQPKSKPNTNPNPDPNHNPNAYFNANPIRNKKPYSLLQSRC